MTNVVFGFRPQYFQEGGFKRRTTTGIGKDCLSNAGLSNCNDERSFFSNELDNSNVSEITLLSDVFKNCDAFLTAFQGLNYKLIAKKDIYTIMLQLTKEHFSRKYQTHINLQTIETYKKKFKKSLKKLYKEYLVTMEDEADEFEKQIMTNKGIIEVVYSTAKSI